MASIKQLCTALVQLKINHEFLIKLLENFKLFDKNTRKSIDTPDMLSNNFVGVNELLESWFRFFTVVKDEVIFVSDGALIREHHKLRGQNTIMARSSDLFFNVNIPHRLSSASVRGLISLCNTNKVDRVFRYALDNALRIELEVLDFVVLLRDISRSFMEFLERIVVVDDHRFRAFDPENLCMYHFNLYDVNEYWTIQQLDTRRSCVFQHRFYGAMYRRDPTLLLAESAYPVLAPTNVNSYEEILLMCISSERVQKWMSMSVVKAAKRKFDNLNKYTRPRM